MTLEFGLFVMNLGKDECKRWVSERQIALLRAVERRDNSRTSTVVLKTAKERFDVNCRGFITCQVSKVI